MQKVELFKPEDFDGAECYSNSANKKLQEYLESCPVAYFKYLGGKPFNLGPELNKEDDTHTARLAFIEELAKESCKHEPTFVNDGDTINWKFSCKRCGVKLEAEWKEVK